jgi:hypothetical protein
MDAEWATAATAIAAIVATTAQGTWLRFRQEDSERKMRIREDQKESARIAADVLGPIQALLVDLKPMPIAVGARVELWEMLNGVNERWRGETRPRLHALAVSNPDVQIRQATEQLDVATNNVFYIDRLLLEEVLVHKDFNESLRLAEWDFEWAQETLNYLGCLLRGEEVGDLPRHPSQGRDVRRR